MRAAKRATGEQRDRRAAPRRSRRLPPSPRTSAGGTAPSSASGRARRRAAARGSATSGSNGRAKREFRISTGASGSRGEGAMSSTTTAAPSPASTSARSAASWRRGTQQSAMKVRCVAPTLPTASSRSSSPAMPARRSRSRSTCGTSSARRWSSAAAIACGRSARRRSIAFTAPCSERLERVGERDVANLSPPEQGPHGRAIGVGEHDQTADGARLDTRGQERELRPSSSLSCPRSVCTTSSSSVLSTSATVPSRRWRRSSSSSSASSGTSGSSRRSGSR